MNVILQQKKNDLRKKLNERVDGTKALTEAAVKKLFTELLSECGLELKFEVSDFDTFTAPTQRIVNRIVHFDFNLFDCETGYSEITSVTVEGSDKGSRTGDRTYWAALKYFLSNTFLVAIEDDSEDEAFYKNEVKATISQIAKLKKIYTGDNLTMLLNKNNIQKIEDLPFDTADSILQQLGEGAKNE